MRAQDNHRKALILTSIGGFLPQFLTGDVQLLQEAGYEVHYASNFHRNVYRFDPEALQREGVKLHQVNLHKKPWHVLRNAGALIRLVRLIRRENISLIHCHNPVGGMLGRLAGALSGRHPVVMYTAHGFHFFRGASKLSWLLFYPAERFLARLTDVLVTINREDYERAKRFHLKKGGRVVQIPGVGYDPGRFHARPEERARMRKELGIPDNAFHMVTAAELNANKNQSTVLQAMAELSDSEVYYSICGRGERKEALQEEIRTLGLTDRARLLGYRTDMELVLQSADVFLFPSLREGFGMAAVEALATGIPVIAADNRGTREYMQPEENGTLCSATDPSAWAAAIRRMKNDPSLRKHWSRGALESAKRFTRAASMERMRQIYGAISGKTWRET